MGPAREVLSGDHTRRTLIERLNYLRAGSLPFAAPKRVLQTSEPCLVRDVLQVLRGCPTSILPWDPVGECFYVRNGVYVLHLSQSSLYNILQVFARAASSLRRVEFFIGRVMKGTQESGLNPISRAQPTLEAFVSVVDMRLRSLRTAALEKELEAAAGKAGMGVTLLSLFANLTRHWSPLKPLSLLSKGAEFLQHMVDVAVPEPERLYKDDISAGELATHILSSLYEEMDSFCLLQDGEEQAYGTLLLLFVGCLWPIISSLDAWLREGVLSDPAGELFFYEDESVPIENSAFWESGYHFRATNVLGDEESNQLLYHSPGSDKDAPNSGPVGNFWKLPAISSLSVCGVVPGGLVCPSFLQPLAKAILSAGKSLQLLQYVKRKHAEVDQKSLQVAHVPSKGPLAFLPIALNLLIQGPGRKGSSEFEAICSCGSGTSEVSQVSNGISLEQVSLYEQFCASLRTLLGEAPVKHFLEEGVITVLPRYLCCCSKLGIPTRKDFLGVAFNKESSGLGGPLLYLEKEVNHPEGNHETTQGISTGIGTSFSGHATQNFKDLPGAETFMESSGKPVPAENDSDHIIKELGTPLAIKLQARVLQKTVQKDLLKLAPYCNLYCLEDAQLCTDVFDPSDVYKAHFVKEEVGAALCSAAKPNESCEEVEMQPRSTTKDMGFESPLRRLTDFKYGLGCGKVLLQHDRQTLTAAEKLLPYPTLLPSFYEQHNVSKRLPCQSNSRNVESMLEWIQSATLKATPALVVVQECLTSSIQKQVDHVGQHLLAKLMGEWRLMEELALLRAIYLVGSGDLLQQFASVLFNKLDRGEPWDDLYELNTMLQESVRSSSHVLVLPSLDSLVVTVLPRTPGKAQSGPRSISSTPQIAGHAPSFGIDSMDSLFFTYKVAWPLELIIDGKAIKKYNQVMLFLLKVKRAKHALDKACRWTWKSGVGDVAVHRQRLLLQQKLMHFVNTLHQYVMDRVLYSAWVELCESMSAAGSLDEVIAYHDTYLSSIQRQCLVAPDKLWALIAGRVKTILGLALKYCSIQRVLCDGVGTPALSAWCQLEIEGVERQFDECMVFLMRVLSFKLNVGHFPHLADLVTRINYNYYYITEDGQLSTPVPEIGHAGRTSRRV